MVTYTIKVVIVVVVCAVVEKASRDTATEEEVEHRPLSNPIITRESHCTKPTHLTILLSLEFSLLTAYFPFLLSRHSSGKIHRRR